MSELLAALDQLTKAHGPSALAEAWRMIRAKLWKQRRQAKESEGKLAAAYREIVAFRDKAKADGMPDAEIRRSVEAVLRDVWPKPRGRVEPWHVYCDVCEDTGLVMNSCSGQPGCGFAKGKPHDPHTFGRPCSCSRGARFIVKTPAELDAVAVAAKTNKPTRFGR